MILSKYKYLLASLVLLTGLFLFKGINPVFSLLIIPIIYITKILMAHQKHKNIVFSFIRFIGHKFITKDFKSLICIILCLESLCIVMKIKYGFPNIFFICVLIIAPFLDFSSKVLKMKRVEEYLEKFYQDDVRLIDLDKGILLVHAKIPLSETEKSKFEIILNSSIVSITQDKLNKRHYTIKYDKYYNKDYRKHEIGTATRLTEILKARPFNDKPILSNIEHSDIDTKITILSLVPKKKLLAQKANIEQHWGCKKGTMSIDFEDGKVIFTHRHTNVKQYCIDDQLPPKPHDMNIPFVLGMDRKTGGIIINDVLKLQHTMFLGMTGSAKSSLVHSWLYYIMYYYDGIKFVGVDLKGSELPDVYKGFNNFDVCGIMDGDDINESMEIVLNQFRKMEQEYYKRVNLFKSVKCKDISGYNLRVAKEKKLPWIIFIIDEANAIVQTIKKKNKEIGEEIENIVDNLMARSRSTGMLNWHTMQELTKENYSVAWRRGMMTRIIMKVQEVRQAQMGIEGNPDLADEAIEQTIGQFIMKDVYNNISKVQNIRVSDQLDDKLYKAIERKYKTNIENVSNELPTMGINPIKQ